MPRKKDSETYRPSQEDIRRACTEIQASWPPQEEQRRKVMEVDTLKVRMTTSPITHKK